MDTAEFKTAALEAEFETGEREPTIEKAQSGVLKRLIRMSFGFFVFVLGIIMLPLPGPGMLVVALGLLILSRDVRWADRLLNKLRDKTPGVPAEGEPWPKLTIALSIIAAVVFTSLSIAYYTSR